MIERNKQVDDQQKKHAEEKERQQKPDKKAKIEPGHEHARMATDPEAAKDPGYIERMNEKTSKH